MCMPKEELSEALKKTKVDLAYETLGYLIRILHKNGSLSEQQMRGLLRDLEV